MLLMHRPYAQLHDRIEAFADRNHQMQSFVDALWAPLHATGISWLGFYLDVGGDQLILGPRRDKPACSPIGLHGACGRAFLTKQPLIVRDVAELGANYVACDPRDKSEVVLPLFDSANQCWGVFDVDSWEVGAFDETDVEGLTELLHRAGLTQ